MGYVGGDEGSAFGSAARETVRPFDRLEFLPLFGQLSHVRHRGHSIHAGLRPDDRRLADAMLGPSPIAVPTTTCCARAGAVAWRAPPLDHRPRHRPPAAGQRGRLDPWSRQNGEIYNYVELREELLAARPHPATHGDTEAIVHLYEDHGDRFVEHLRGHVRDRALGRPPPSGSSWPATGSARSRSTGGLPTAA